MKNLNIIDRVKTFENACEVLGIGEITFNENDAKDEIAYKKLKIIYKALNEGCKPDWSNLAETKYYPYFKMSPFGFADTLCGAWATCSLTGSHLCGKTDTIAEYAGRQFVDIYKDFYN